MNLLETYYGITQTNGAYTNTPLSTSVKKYFNFDFDNITKEEVRNSTVFWNFGDPNSPENEDVQNILSTVTHDYNYSGSYLVTIIANINGVPFHYEQRVNI